MMKNYCIIFLLLLNTVCLHAQKSEKLRIGLSGKVASVTIVEYQGSIFDTLTNTPQGGFSYAQKSVEFFHQNGNLDSTVYYIQPFGETVDVVTCRRVFSYNDQQQLQLKRSFYTEFTQSSEYYNWLNPYACYSVGHSNPFGMDSTTLDTAFYYFDRQMRDSVHYRTPFNRQVGEGKIRSRFEYFTNESGKGCTITVTNPFSDVSYKSIEKQLLPDQFNNPTLIYLYRENGFFDKKEIYLDAVYLISYTYYP